VLPIAPRLPTRRKGPFKVLKGAAAYVGCEEPVLLGTRRDLCEQVFEGIADWNPLLLRARARTGFGRWRGVGAS